MPKIDKKNGLCLVGIINELKTIEFNDETIEAKSLFCILTDNNDKVIHFSENLMQMF
jgi:hypothetical protein